MSEKLEKLINQGNNYEEQVKYMREIRVRILAKFENLPFLGKWIEHQT